MCEGTKSCKPVKHFHGARYTEPLSFEFPHFEVSSIATIDKWSLLKFPNKNLQHRLCLISSLGAVENSSPILHSTNRYGSYNVLSAAKDLFPPS